MKIRFERQPFQEQCVGNIIFVLNNFDFENNNTSDLTKGLKTLYENTDIPPIPVKLKDISQELKLDVLMETGTGKTFTYIKTIFEINKQFGINKFIIFVPRKAIRQGVLKNIELTKEFFYADDKYKKYLETYIYEGGVSSINGYLRNSDELSVLVLTNSSIDKKNTNKLRQANEFFGLTGNALDEIKKLNPIVIIDEPHLLKGKKFTEVFKTFKSLYIRFGATFPQEQEHKISNVVYVLDSINAFKRHLVKKIKVNTVYSRADSLKLIKTNKKKKTADFVWTEDSIENRCKTIRVNEDIGEITGLTEYAGISIVKIEKDKAYLSNMREFELKEGFILSESEIETMIEQTIKLHFEKEEKLFNKKIKELSLFFIPHVDDFRGNNPKIKNIFEKKYKEIRKEFYDKTANIQYKKYLDKDFCPVSGGLAVCGGYFSGDKGSDEEKEKMGTDLILKDKEALLSFEKPLRFIFSVWALQEGWDNPNIFNLCKLTNTSSQTSRKQQVGRGLRLAVNQSGNRITINNVENENDFYGINTLDVVVSGYEMNFIEEIQREINDGSFALCREYIVAADLVGSGFNEQEAHKTIGVLEDNKAIEFNESENKYLKKPHFEEFIKNNREKFNFLDDEKYKQLSDACDYKSRTELYVQNGLKKTKVAVRPKKLEEFKELWETINKKAQILYKDVDENSLIDAVSEKFNKEDINQVSKQIVTKEYDPKTNSIKVFKINNFGVPDFFKDNKFNDFINEFRDKYPLNFILNLFRKIDTQRIKNDPQKARDILNKMIKDEIHRNIIEKVDYKFTPEIKITSLQETDGEYKKSIDSSALGLRCEETTAVNENYLYDKLVYDSDIEKTVILKDPVEINGCKVTVFAKLPAISIPTPYKNYNPDFAYLIEKPQGKKLFLIVETKGYYSQEDIPPAEKQKIKYAEKFFKKLQELCPNVEITYKKRLNKCLLEDLIKEFCNETK
uniref:Type III restriction enzyme n=1 Tax=Candidatus Endomicrobium sp. MdMp-027 TaxID=1837116 RepID=A0A1C9ZT91_9BACT|nr:type III restriction enzyme [Candidatus Endomicrobium sp. MdMp-027]